MPKPPTISFPQVYAAVATDIMTRLGDSMAAQAGPPIGEDIVPATDADRAEAWWARRPEATDEAMQTLANQKYAEHRQAGMDDEKAQWATREDLTHFRYGQRLKLYTYGQVGFKAQVAEATRLSKLAARTSTPNPEPPPPTMPSAAMTNAAALPATPDTTLTTPPPGGMPAPLSGVATTPPPSAPPAPGGY